MCDDLEWVKLGDKSLEKKTPSQDPFLALQTVRRREKCIVAGRRFSMRHAYIFPFLFVSRSKYNFLFHRDDIFVDSFFIFYQVAQEAH
jgi:hypothetical protein